MSGVPRQEGEDEYVEEEHSEDVIEGETVLALARRICRHSLPFHRSKCSVIGLGFLRLVTLPPATKVALY